LHLHHGPLRACRLAALAPDLDLHRAALASVFSMDWIGLDLDWGGTVKSLWLLAPKMGGKFAAFPPLVRAKPSQNLFALSTSALAPLLLYCRQKCVNDYHTVVFFYKKSIDLFMILNISVKNL
jgi:hypothetical protein